MSLTAPARAARRSLFQRILVIGGLVAVAALLLFAATSKARAFSPEILAAKRHFLQCLQLLVTDPDAHVRTCNPGPIVPQLNTLASTGNSGTQRVKKEEPKEEEPEEEECSSVHTRLSSPSGEGGCHYE